MNHVAGSRFALGADHGRALGDAAQGFAEVARSADKGRCERMLVDVVSFIGRRKDLAFVDEVHAEFLQNLRFGKVPDPGLRHDRNRNRRDDSFDELGICHAGHAAFGADHGGHPLERHH